jgi:hypothetical protein
MPPPTSFLVPLYSLFFLFLFPLVRHLAASGTSCPFPTKEKDKEERERIKRNEEKGSNITLNYASPWSGGSGWCPQPRRGGDTA